MNGDDDRLVAALADRYAIERELGRGGMATVYLAQDLRHRRRVAVKVLRPDLVAVLGRDRFFREIEVAAQLQHPHILPLLDSGEANGLLYYVMPYVDGKSLRDRLAREGELPIGEAVRILIELADGLATAHAAGVVHRDIKPDNIMLSGRHALIMDFGIAKAVSDATDHRQLTTAGVTLGTPAYMAPEQAAADPHLDHRVDIYAVGALGYELLTGRPPFVGHSAQQVLAAHMTQEPDPVDRYRPGTPRRLCEVVMRCLAKRPADRWQRAEDLLEALEPLAVSSPSITPVENQPASMRAGPPRQFPRWAAWLAGGALVAAGALALSLRQGPSDVLKLGRRTAVAVGDEMERWPALTPDGSAVVYTRRSDTTSAIVIQQVDGGAPIPVNVKVGGFLCCQSVSPDGARLLFNDRHSLYVMPTLGGQVRWLADARSFGSAWAPDGQAIAFAPTLDSIVVMAFDGSARRLVARGREVHSPAWSGDGRFIAFVDGNPDFHLEGNIASSTVMVVPATGGDAVNVSGSAGHNTSPVWVPGRRALLYLSDREVGRDIYQQAITASGAPDGPAVRITTGLNPERIAVSADGRRIAWSTFTVVSNVRALPIPDRDSVPLSSATPVTTGAQHVEAARFSPDGAWLYYDSDRSGNADIWRIPLAGGAPEQITNDPAPEFGPQVSPDGRFVSFHSIRAGLNNREIYVQPVTGGPAVNVSASPGDDRIASWSRDGRALAWMDLFSADSAILVSRRGAGGSWLPARRYATPHGASEPIWDDRGQVEFHTPNALYRLDPRTGSTTLVLAVGAPDDSIYIDTRGTDGHTLYVLAKELLGARIIAYAPPDWRGRTVVWSDSPLSQMIRGTIGIRSGMLYVPVAEQRLDVWVAEVGGN